MTVAANQGAPITDEALTFCRIHQPANEPSTLSAGGLGGRWVGQASASLDAPMLGSAGAVFDSWCGSVPVQAGQHGCVRYLTDGHWLHGLAEIDDSTLGLQTAAQRAYADVFDVLAAHPCRHLLRLWNYLAGINRETDGVERYRLFNAGRQQAFIDAQRSAYEGSPAACALGTQGGPLRVYFLAGRKPPLAIENPRQVSAYRYPSAYGQRSPTFSRAALADAGNGRSALFISGTASIVGHASVHLGDVRRQTEESLVNIAALREVAALRAGVAFAASELICTVYLRRALDLATVRATFEEAVGRDSKAAREAVYLQADICRADLLVEIEGHAFARTGGMT